MPTSRGLIAPITLSPAGTDTVDKALRAARQDRRACVNQRSHLVGAYGAQRACGRREKALGKRVDRRIRGAAQRVGDPRAIGLARGAAQHVERRMGHDPSIAGRRAPSARLPDPCLSTCQR